MQTEKNDIFKIVITLVIALLFVIPIAYFVMEAQKGNDLNPTQVNVPGKEIVDEEKNAQLSIDPALDIDNYKLSNEINLSIDFCKENEIVKKLNASVVLERQEAGELTLKAVSNQNWNEAEINQEMSKNVCGLGDSFIGFIGENSEYLLFASGCPAAGPAGADFTSCPERLAELKKLLDPALNVNNYKMSGDADLEIEFCEETEFVKKLNASMVLERQEAGELTLKIVPNQNWTKAEITKEISENVCGISYQFIGFIGANPEYLLFASPCPAAGDENTDFTSCPNRVGEIEKYFE
jgi:hypothetical protein